MSIIITCIFRFENRGKRKVEVNCFNINNAVNSIESAIIKELNDMYIPESGTVLVQSFTCKDINNGLNLHDYGNRNIDKNELKPGKVYDFDVKAIFTTSDFGGRRKTRKSRKSRKSRR